MADYTKLDIKEIHTLLENYDLGTFESVEPLSGGQANSSYKIKTKKGWFTLSVCDEKTAQELLTMTRVLKRLSEHSFKSTRLICTTNGKPFVDYQSKPVYVKEFIDAEVIRDLDESMLNQVGSAMAILHGIEAPDDLPQAFPYGRASFDEILKIDIDHPFKNWLEKKTVFLDSALDLSMAKGFIHGDIFWDNLLFKKGRLAAVLDFEEACHYYLLYDLGMASVGCCAENGQFITKKIKALLKGYQISRPLTDKEKELFRPFLVYAATAATFWRFRQYNIRYPQADLGDSYQELAGLADQAESMDKGWYAYFFKD
ncbi:MAG: homoserine kinase [Desulfobacterales bacterium]|nr:homoserine kinase [Desulfobacterales bacterium]